MRTGPFASRRVIRLTNLLTSSSFDLINWDHFLSSTLLFFISYLSVSSYLIIVLFQFFRLSNLFVFFH